MENKLIKNSSLKENYDNFMREYLELSNMKEAPEKNNSAVEFYLPHHWVINEYSLTIKLIVVFDGSAKSKASVMKNFPNLLCHTLISLYCFIHLALLYHLIKFAINGKALMQI